MNKIHKKQGKTTAKSLGLKSVLKVDDKLVVSTFGKQSNPMVVEQSISKESGEKEFFVSENQIKFNSNLDKESQTLKLTSTEHNKNIININLDKADSSQIGMDYLKLKPVFEREMFGETFTDNVHIQIAYNILDLKKIISLHIGNTAQALTSLQRGNNDFIGMFPLDKPLSFNPDPKQKLDLIGIKKLSPYFMYFDGALKSNSEKTDAITENDIYNYNTMRTLSLIRQGCAHSGELSSILYNFQNDSKYHDIARHAQDVFQEDLNKFNRSFLSNSDKNLFVLSEIYNCKYEEQKKEILAKDYYRFILYKDSKNLGFSLKTIRNKIIEGVFDEKELSGKLQTIRQKLNGILDFYLYKYYLDNPNHIENIISQLRESKTDEDKEKIYETEYVRLSSENSGFVNKLCIDIVNKVNWLIDVDRHNRGKRNHFFKLYANVTSSNIVCSELPSAIFVLCKFLDGKEVNELTTSIINKLENIKSLISALVTLDKWDGFENKYRIFDLSNIDHLINDFRMVKNLSATKRKLKKQRDGKVGKRLYCDAINMFKPSNFVSTKDETGTGLDTYLSVFFKKDEEAGKKVRNFLSNTIIKNRRFIYLIKYIDPRDCYKLVHNEKILRFVLGQYDENQMPLNQLQRYYDAVIENKEGFRRNNNRQQMIDTLVREITNISSFETILGFGSGLARRGNDNYINHQKQVISLYLTIAYLIVKGIVHTNSIYFIAWASFERDFSFKYGRNLDEEANEYFKLVNDYMFNKKPRVRDLLEHNIQEASTNVSHSIYRAYRNKVMHLNLCNEFVRYIDDIGIIHSYFDIYNYVVQKWVLSNDESFVNKDYQNKLANDLNQHKSYQRNFLKIIDLPFAYNLARYKNLTIGDLFNDKYPVPKETLKEYFNEE